MSSPQQPGPTAPGSSTGTAGKQRRRLWSWVSKGMVALPVAGLVLGVAGSLSPYAGMLAGGFVGIYLASRMWFVDHPATWWYDLVFIAVLVGTALVGAATSAATCSILPLTGTTTRACVSLTLLGSLRLHLWVLCVTGGLTWFLMRLWAWGGLRRN